MSQQPVRVRFAPSPTGFLHIGGARTALFNYLYAKKHGGSFILRIEDTDRERSTQEAVDAIVEGMQWLGLDWDEGPFYQTQRYDLYAAEIPKLLESEQAYRCYCTPDQLDAMRAELRVQKKKPQYDGRCWEKRHQVLDQPHTIRFRIPEGKTIIDDLVKGPVEVSHKELEDFIIARTDGIPTYNFVVVVDDADMRISHVIRGDDHLNNTPKQILLAKALGFDVPKFAHFPMILGQDKARLSKRHGATAVQMYRDMGYLPHAMLNFLVRLGWSHKDQEIFSMQEMVDAFGFESAGTSPGIFNPEKLLWLNQHYIKETPYEGIMQALDRFIDIPEARKDAPQMQEVIDMVRERAKNLEEMAMLCRFYTDDDLEISDQDRTKFLKAESKTYIQALYVKLDDLQDWTKDSVEHAFKETLQALEVGFGKLGQPLRIILTASRFSPGIYDILLVLGRDRTLARLNAWLKNA